VNARTPPNFKPIVTLAPHSGIQFLDFAFTLDGSFRLSRSFLEEDRPDGGGKMLHALVAEEGGWAHPLTGDLVESERTYSLNIQRALEPFLDRWVPIPFMRILGRDEAGRDVFDQGPSNWARLFLTEAEGSSDVEKSYDVVVAFDTELDARSREAGHPYTAPTLADARVEETFGFSAFDDDVAWFVSEPWLDQWLEELYYDLLRSKDRNRRFRPENLPHELEHIARYLMLLSLIEKVCRFPRIRLIDTISTEKSYVPIRVDLVIDVGNSRTCGILIESDPDDNDRLDLSKSYVLSLRDLSRPNQVHALPFESRVEFSRPSFGNEGISRLSGRANAFYWPSLTRVGPEAVRLSVGGAGTEGATGLSSPKRYLWDRRALNQVWRFRDGGSPGSPQEPQVSGPVLAFITEEGDVLRQLRRPASAAIRPKFSRSSLFTFLMTEVVLQAVAGINSVESRSRQRNSDIPRELRQIIMTVPPATPLAERRIMRERVEGAIKLAWQMLKWTDARQFTPPPEPKVQIAFDEATCTQIVYLFSEITQKLQRSASDFFAIMGKTREGFGHDPTLRIASIDIGGGTTDLMIVTYAVEARKVIVPTQQFREGFKIAGDDILEAVVARHILPSVEASLKEAGVQEAQGFLRGLVGADRGGQSEQERQFRRRFVTQVAVPAALAILRKYEGAKPFSEEAPQVFTLAELLATPHAGEAPVAAEFDRLAAQAGAKGFKLETAPVGFVAADIAATVKAVIGPVLNDLAEVIHALDCDVVLISGRPSRFPVVLDLLLSRVPTRPDRIIPMNQYRVGTWYPFRDTLNRVDDPKTTVAVGALLCNLAEAQIDGFVLAKSRLTIKSTAKFIGEMDLSGLIRNDQILFADVDLDGKAKKGESARSVNVFPPLKIGFRQLNLERWPATPLYVIEFTNPASADRLRLPLTVTIERADADEDDEAAKEDFRISEIQDADGTSLRTTDVALRLQTLNSPSGYWLDTGVVDTY
jgi:hypothetical protein